MLNAPHIPESAWWVIAVVTTALFFAVWMPMLPTPKSRYQTALIPVLGMVFLPALGALRNHDSVMLISTYSTVILALTLGVVGRREDMRIAVKQGEDPLGTSAAKAAPANKRLTVQLSTAFVVAFLLWAWLNWG